MIRERSCFTCAANGIRFEVMNHDQLQVGEQREARDQARGNTVFVSPGKPLKPEVQHNTFRMRVEALYNLGSRRLVRLVFKQAEAATLDATVHYRIGRRFELPRGRRPIFICGRRASACCRAMPAAAGRQTDPARGRAAAHEELG